MSVLQLNAKEHRWVLVCQILTLPLNCGAHCWKDWNLKSDKLFTLWTLTKEEQIEIKIEPDSIQCLLPSNFYCWLFNLMPNNISLSIDTSNSHIAPLLCCSPFKRLYFKIWRLFTLWKLKKGAVKKFERDITQHLLPSNIDCWFFNLMPNNISLSIDTSNSHITPLLWCSPLKRLDFKIW